MPSGLRKHLVEKFSLTEDRRHLKYEFILEDPDWLTAPVQQSIQWDYQPDLKPSGVKCDIAAASRFLKEESALQAARKRSDRSTARRCLVSAPIEM